MKINGVLLRTYLDKHRLTNGILADKIGISVVETEALLCGEPVTKPIAEKFIRFFGSMESSKLIDWEALGRKNPLG